LTATESTAHALGLTLKVLPAGNLTEIGKAFDALGINTQALFEISSPRFAATRVAIAASALKKGLPAACEEREFAAAGCLISYGPSFAAMFRRAAYYVDKILKGSRPADLPIEQPSKFELVINLKTAKALGLTVAPGLLSRDDEVIE
jgi:putative ABC transport system substrate-binding protein